MNDRLALTRVQGSKKEGFEQSRPKSSEIRWKVFVVKILQVGGICFWKTVLFSHFLLVILNSR